MCETRSRRTWPWIFIGFGAGAVTLLAACQSPLERTTDDELRDSLLASNKAYLQAVAAGPIVEITRDPSVVDKDLTPERRAELNKMAGPKAYEHDTLDAGEDLAGQTNQPVVNMTLQRAIELTIRHNLEIQQARLLPAIAETQITQAEAAFDPLLFSNVDFQKLDTPRPPAVQPGLTSFGTTDSETTTVSTGIRKPMTTGGEVKVAAEFTRNFSDPSVFAPNPPITNPPTPPTEGFGYYAADLLLSLSQPLLRGFGPDVALAQVSLARSARNQSIQDLRKQMIDDAFNTEQAYWNLVFTRSKLQIQLRLLERTLEDHRRLEQRREHDVSPVRLTEANTFLGLRRADVFRARQDLRQASDALKRLINSPDLPLSGETLILPLDTPADLPIQFSLLDAVTTAIRRRPEIVKAIFEINDTSIRLMVADNARLPQLNLTAGIRYNGIGHNVRQAFGNAVEGDFIDYLVGAQFEMPIGNRGPEGLYRQRQLEREATTLTYRRTAQDVLLDVKTALRQVLSNYEIVGTTRDARLWATDNLRALDEQERHGAALTPEFLLDLKLQSQQRLADAETQEEQALATYNTAIAHFYQSIGSLLERNNVDFEDPTHEPHSGNDD